MILASGTFRHGCVNPGDSHKLQDAMVVLRRGRGGLSYVAGNNHERRTFERPSPSEIGDHGAALALVLFARQTDYRILLTADDIRRIASHARLHGLE
jgi:hypothetical protein